MSNRPVHAEALRLTFNNYNIYVPGKPSVGPVLLENLKIMEEMGLSGSNFSKSEAPYEIARITNALYRNLDLDEQFHNGTSTNIGVIDLNENYVSLVM